MSTDRAVELAARAIAKAKGRNPDDCVMGSGSIAYGGGGKFECHRYAWQDELGAATGALTAAYPELLAEVDLKLQTMVRELLAEDSNEFTKGKITGLGYARQFLAALQLERGSR